MIQEFDYASIVRISISEMLGRPVAIHIYTDPKSLYDAITGINATTETGPLLDLALFPETFELQKIATVVWVPSKDNPADAMTKELKSSALNNWMTNKLYIDRKSWVERQDCKGAGVEITAESVNHK